MKNCKGCNELKSLSGFRQNLGIDGKLRFLNYCKECNNKKACLYYQNNKDKINQYLEKNKEKRRASQKKWVKQNPDKVNQAKRKWEKNHPEKHSQNKRREAKYQTIKMNDSYIIHLLKQSTSLEYKDIRNKPELIKAYRANLKIKRFINQNK